MTPAPFGHFFPRSPKSCLSHTDGRFTCRRCSPDRGISGPVEPRYLLGRRLEEL